MSDVSSRQVAGVTGEGAPAACHIEGCDKPLKVKAARLCSKHYARVLRHGDPYTVRNPRRGACSIDGCQERHWGYGFCSGHQPVPDTPDPDDELQVEECVDCGGDPMGGGCLRCERCLRADLAARTARRHAGGNVTGRTDPARPSIPHVRVSLRRVA